MFPSNAKLFLKPCARSRVIRVSFYLPPLFTAEHIFEVKKTTAMRGEGEESSVDRRKIIVFIFFFGSPL